MIKTKLQKVRIHPLTVCMLSLVGVACLLRLLFLSYGWPGTNSDEAIIDLMALHISQGKEFPIFFYGQGYMGAIQAYLGGLLFHLLGVSLFTVRVGLLLLFAGFLIAIYILSCTIYSRGFALFIVLLLTFGSGSLISIFLFANGGYAETPLFAILLVLITTKLALSASSETKSRWRRITAYVLLGWIGGTAIYSHALILPALFITSLLLWLFCRQELRSRSGLALFGGFLLGLLPMILYNLTAPPGMDSFHAFAGSTGFGASRNGVSFLQQIAHAFFITLPHATGITPICWVQEPMQPVNNILAFYDNANPMACAIRYGSWSLGYVTLWICSCLLVTIPLWKRRREILRQELSPEERQDTIRQMVHLSLLVIVALSFLLYLAGRPAALNPRTTTRYLTCLIFAPPALLWPLWASLRNRLPSFTQLRWQQKILPLIQSSILFGTFALFLYGSLAIFPELSRTQRDLQQQHEVVDKLLELKVTRFYSEYWTCNRLIFTSQEQLICVNLDEQMQMGHNRYPAYVEMVESTPKPLPHVYQLNSAHEEAFLNSYVSEGEVNYQRYVSGNYVIYIPET